MEDWYKMSTSSTVYAARINTPVHISLTGLSSTGQRPPTSARSTSNEVLTTSRRFESRGMQIRPTFGSSVRHGSLTLTICPAPSPTTLTGGQSSTSKIVAGNDGHRWTGDLGRHVDVNDDVLTSATDRQVRPRLPDYAEIEQPPPYNPDFLVPSSCHRWSAVDGRRWSSTSARCPPPPPPSRRSSATAEMRSSMALVAEQSVTDINDDDDEVFFVEKTSTF